MFYITHNSPVQHTACKNVYTDEIMLYGIHVKNALVLQCIFF